MFVLRDARVSDVRGGPTNRRKASQRCAAWAQIHLRGYEEGNGGTERRTRFFHVYLEADALENSYDEPSTRSR